MADDDDMDEGAPPALPGLRVHAAAPSGSLTPEEIERFGIQEQIARAARNRGETGTPEKLSPGAVAGMNSRPQAGDVIQLPSADPPGRFDPEVAKMLIEKFPAFNVGWKDPLKEKWFAAYAELMRLVKG